jgi:medium-chain acyl-[acyl-carrier-protein] hydrolase
MRELAHPWFPRRYAAERAQLRLFCFPYAGGTSQIYRGWDQHLPPTVEVIPVELPGRASRLREPAFVRLLDLVHALTPAMAPIVDLPFALFGHSMGAIIAFELARDLRRVLGREPEVLCVSGRRAPQVPSDKPPTYDLPKDGFISEVKRIGGTPREVLEQAELMELVSPLLRADFQLIETYEYTAGAPLVCPITTYGGLADNEETGELLSMWRSQTTSGFALHMLPGDHFFLRTSQTRLLGLLSRQLKDVLARGRMSKTSGG